MVPQAPFNPVTAYAATIAAEAPVTTLLACAVGGLAVAYLIRRRAAAKNRSKGHDAPVSQEVVVQPNGLISMQVDAFFFDLQLLNDCSCLVMLAERTLRELKANPSLYTPTIDDLCEGVLEEKEQRWKYALALREMMVSDPVVVCTVPLKPVCFDYLIGLQRAAAGVPPIAPEPPSDPSGRVPGEAPLLTYFRRYMTDAITDALTVRNVVSPTRS